MYALLTRLFPKQFGVFDQFGGNRLSSPIGYWNALGLLAAIGCLLALGLAARGGVLVRMAAAASIVVLVLTLYFTFGRGRLDRTVRGLVGNAHRRPAPTSADRDRAVVAVWPAIGLYFASGQRAHSQVVDVSIASAQKDGHALAIIAVLVDHGAALRCSCLDALESRPKLNPGRRLRLVFVALLLCALPWRLRPLSPATGRRRIARDGWNTSSILTERPNGSNLNIACSAFRATAASTTGALPSTRSRAPVARLGSRHVRRVLVPVPPVKR